MNALTSRRGFLSKSVMASVAATTGMSVADVEKMQKSEEDRMAQCLDGGKFYHLGLVALYYCPDYDSFDESATATAFIDECKFKSDEGNIKCIIPVECKVIFGNEFSDDERSLEHHSECIVYRNDDKQVHKIMFPAYYYNSKMFHMPDLSWVKDFLAKSAAQYGEPK